LIVKFQSVLIETVKVNQHSNFANFQAQNFPCKHQQLKILRNTTNLLPVSGNDDDRVDIEINVTNCTDDDAPDFTTDDDVAVHTNFNYRASNACDRNVIDLMDEGDNYVSSKHYVPLCGGDLQLVPTITNTVYAENFDAEFIRMMAELLNSSEQFNYQRDRIVNITDENEYLFVKQPRDAANFPNDEQREFIFGNSGDDVENDTKNQIRFKEHDGNENEAIRQPGGVPQLHPTSDKLDNCFSESKIGVCDFERG
jgi:hypothetical protein